MFSLLDVTAEITRSERNLRYFSVHSVQTFQCYLQSTASMSYASIQGSHALSHLRSCKSIILICSRYLCNYVKIKIIANSYFTEKGRETKKNEIDMEWHKYVFSLLWISLQTNGISR